MTARHGDHKWPQAEPVNNVAVIDPIVRGPRGRGISSTFCRPYRLRFTPEHPRLDGVSDQPTVRRVAVAFHRDQGAGVTRTRTRFAVSKRRAGKGRSTTIPMGLSELTEQLARKCLVLAAVGELAAAAQHQCLIEGAADGRAIGEFAALFLKSDARRLELLQIKPGKEIADQLGASRGMFHAGSLELPVGMVQSAGDAIVSRSHPGPAAGSAGRGPALPLQ